MIRAAIVFVVFFANCVFAEEIIAVADLKFVKDTGKTAGVLCYGEDDKNCDQWSTFYLYEAKVKKVLNGELGVKRFTVIYGRHAFRQNNHKNAFVRLNKLPEGADAQYQILEFGQKFELVCFNSAEMKKLDSKLEIYSESLKCAEQEEL